MEKIDEAVSGRKEIDADVLEELEFALITADLGARTTSEVLERIRQQMQRHQLSDAAQLKTAIKALRSLWSKSARKAKPRTSSVAVVWR